MRYRVPKLYLNQHRVLEKTYNVPRTSEAPNISELTESLQLSESDVMQAAYLLKGKGFVNVDRSKKPFVVTCTPDGAQILIQEALLDEGREKAKANLLRWMQMTGILVAALISVSTFVVNIVNTNSNSKSIEQLKSEVNYLKQESESRKLKFEKGYRASGRPKIVK